LPFSFRSNVVPDPITPCHLPHHLTGHTNVHNKKRGKEVVMVNTKHSLAERKQKKNETVILPVVIRDM
jgi:hypothetical protein